MGSNSFLWSVNTPTSYVLSFAAFENSTVTSVRARETPTGCQSSLYWSMKSSILLSNSFSRNLKNSGRREMGLYFDKLHVSSFFFFTLLWLLLFSCCYEFDRPRNIKNILSLVTLILYRLRFASLVWCVIDSLSKVFFFLQSIWKLFVIHCLSSYFFLIFLRIQYMPCQHPLQYIPMPSYVLTSTHLEHPCTTLSCSVCDRFCGHAGSRCSWCCKL